MSTTTLPGWEDEESEDWWPWNLINAEGLPASPFLTDSWKLP